LLLLTTEVFTTWVSTSRSTLTTLVHLSHNGMEDIFKLLKFTFIFLSIDIPVGLEPIEIILYGINESFLILI